MINENIYSKNHTISINIDESTFQKIQHHAIQNGEDIDQCLSSAISEAVNLWDDYDQIFSTLNLKEKVPVF